MTACINNSSVYTQAPYTNPLPPSFTTTIYCFTYDCMLVNNSYCRFYILYYIEVLINQIPDIILKTVIKNNVDVHQAARMCVH